MPGVKNAEPNNADEAGEHLRRLGLQADDRALAAEFPCGEVELEQAESKASRIHFPDRDCRTSSLTTPYAKRKKIGAAFCFQI